MARLLFPDEGQRLIYQPGSSAGKPLTAADGFRFLISTDDAGVTPADITDTDDAAIADSILTVDGSSLLPYFNGPDDASDLLYITQVDSNDATVGDTYPLYANDSAIGLTAHSADADAHHAEDHASRHETGGADPVDLSDQFDAAGAAAAAQSAAEATAASDATTKANAAQSAAEATADGELTTHDGTSGAHGIPTTARSFLTTDASGDLTDQDYKIIELDLAGVAPGLKMLAEGYEDGGGPAVLDISALSGAPAGTQFLSGWAMSDIVANDRFFAIFDDAVAQALLAIQSNPSDSQYNLTLSTPVGGGITVTSYYGDHPAYPNEVYLEFNANRTSFGGVRLQSIGDGTDNQDAVSKLQMETADSAAQSAAEATAAGDATTKANAAQSAAQAYSDSLLHLPTPADPADDGKVPTAGGGAYTLETPAAGGGGSEIPQPFPAGKSPAVYGVPGLTSYHDTASRAIDVDEPRFHPMMVTQAITITEAHINVQTAGTLLLPGIFLLDDDMVPVGDDLLGQAAWDVSTTGYKSHTGLSVSLSPGMYASALHSNDGSVVLQTIRGFCQNEMFFRANVWTQYPGWHQYNRTYDGTWETSPQATQFQMNVGHPTKPILFVWTVD